MKSSNSLAPSQNTNITKAAPFSVFLDSDAIKQKINQIVATPKEGAQFIASLVASVAANPSLQQCTHLSLLNCGLQCHALGLSTNPALGQCHMVPFANNDQGVTEATFIPGWKGYYQLALRSGYYKKINVVPMKEGEVIHWDPIEEELTYSLIDDFETRDQTPTVGYYAFYEYLNGFRKAMYWSRVQMEKHAKRYSFAFNRDLNKGKTDSFWSKDFDAMGCKTMVRQLLSKYGIMSVEMQTLFDNDNEAMDRYESSFVSSDGSAEVPAPPAQEKANESTEHDTGSEVVKQAPIKATPKTGIKASANKEEPIEGTFKEVPEGDDSVANNAAIKGFFGE